MTQDSSTYWKKARTEVRAAGFDPDRAAETNAVVTIASAYTNAHRCNNRVRQITDLLVELIGERGGTASLDPVDQAVDHVARCALQIDNAKSRLDTLAQRLERLDERVDPDREDGHGGDRRGA